MHLNWPLIIALAALLKPLWESLRGIYRRIFTSGVKQQMTVAQAQEFLRRLEEFRIELRRVNKNYLSDVQDIYAAISQNNDLQNERHEEFYREFVDLRVKVAAYTKDANGHIT